MNRWTTWQRVTLLTLLVSTVAVAPAMVTAASRRTGEGAFGVTRQAFQWRTDPTTTRSDEWQSLVLFGEDRDGGPALGSAPLAFASRGGMSVTVSADFKGAPVELRIRDGRRILRPGKAKFVPRGRGTSTSFTFVGARQARASCHSVQVEWRSPTGAEVTFRRGDIVVTYKPEALKDGACV